MFLQKARRKIAKKSFIDIFFLQVKEEKIEGKKRLRSFYDHVNVVPELVRACACLCVLVRVNTRACTCVPRIKTRCY